MPTPRISGAPVRALARFARTGAGAATVYRSLRKDLRANELAALPDGLRAELLFDLTPSAGRPPRAATDHPEPALPLPQGGWSPTSDRIATLYREGKETPLAVAERALARARELAALTPTCGPIFVYDDERAKHAAAESTERHRKGQSRGPLDGVPFVVKEQSCALGLPRQAGTTWMSDAPSEADSAFVAALRGAGAVMLGLSPMTELGMSPLGQNPNRPMPRNPHAPGHLAGGSSTGSGVAVGTGLVPFAIGVDGGGSIRTPAAWNGVFGLKPTWGRVSRRGTIAEGSMSHVGPLAASTVDIAHVMDVISGPDPADRQTSAAPPLAKGTFLRAVGRGVRGLRVGVDERDWADAAPSVERACRDALRALEREGAVLVPVRLELARFVVPIGALSIGPEARALNLKNFERYADRMTPDLQISFQAISRVSAMDLLDAQRLRTGLRAEVAHAFATDIDLLAMPTTSDTAPAVSDAEMASSFVDPGALGRALRFAFLANLTGLPAGTAPVGVDERGLPIGFQLVGDAYDEATVIAAMAHLERVGAASPPRPKIVGSVL